MDSAEQAALSQKMEGGTPKYFNSRRLAGPGEEGRGAGWQELELILNRHFDHQPVNTSYSSVLLPQALSDAGLCLVSLGFLVFSSFRVYEYFALKFDYILELVVVFQ